MSKTSLFILLVIFVLFVTSVLFLRPRRPTPITTFSPQENSGGEVDVTITPEVLIVDQPSRFKLEFNTHSVELDFDVSKVAELIDGSGKIYQKAIWEGSPPGGHHREGTLTFSESLKETKSITLALLNISNVAKREFTWSL